MRTGSLIARYLAGVIFLVMGLNGFLNFIPFPPPGALRDSSWAPFMSRITCG
jgi:putative oxidoreductase